MSAASSREWGWRAGRFSILLIAAAVMVFNLGVLVVVFMTSLSKTPYIIFPPRGLTLHWYGALGAYENSILYTLRVALFSATLGSTLGTLASIALVRGNLRFKKALLSLFLSPLIVPSTIFGLAALVILIRAGWQAGFWPLSLALAVSGIPFCIRIVVSGLQNLDWRLEAAARTLGATRRRTWLRVMLPIAGPSIAAGWMFSFIFASEDANISIFLAQPTKRTYGAQLLTEAQEFLTPRLAAAGIAVTAITVVCLPILGLVLRIQRRYVGRLDVPIATVAVERESV